MQVAVEPHAYDRIVGSVDADLGVTLIFPVASRLGRRIPLPQPDCPVRLLGLASDNSEARSARGDGPSKKQAVGAEFGLTD